MKNRLKPTVLLLALLTSTACFRNDIRTETFQIDQLRSPEALTLINARLQTLKGVQHTTPDYEARTLTVVFNGRDLYLKNIENAIVKGGFSLPNHPATKADILKLPPELQQ